MDQSNFLRDALSRPPTVISYSVTQDLAAMFPEKTVIHGPIASFDVESFAAAGHCNLERKAAPFPQVVTYWAQPELELMPMPHVSPSRMLMYGPHSVDAGTSTVTITRVQNAWLGVTWEDERFDVLFLHWGENQFHADFWILADKEEVAAGFFAAVSRWTTEVRGEVLVFEGGGWHKDELLYRAIKSVTFDNVILRGSLKQDIRDDVLGFFDARATYDEYGIPWKRGILFVGPPGNGKTHTVKALINSLDQPCLYVKSFRAQHMVDEISIRAVFDRARRTAPCVLVLEDLDSLLTPQNRSFFLNEMDGFATNGGILTLATTNHPERLDPAILDRPSRFDRKYPFDLPELAERRAYLVLWNAGLKPALQLTDEGLDSVTEQTEGFSFAYLKELCLASTMRWLATAEPGAMREVMLAQAGVLREQMVSVPMPGDEPPPDVAMPPDFGMQIGSSARLIGRTRHFGPRMP